MSYQPFYTLDVWKQARRFKNRIYEVVKRFPEHEKYELTSQLRRAVRSIPANVSEGHGRNIYKDQNNFCGIARGSHSETLNHLVNAYDSQYITADELRLIQGEWNELDKVLNGYISFIRSRAANANAKTNTMSVEENDILYGEGAFLQHEEEDLSKT